jgi:hypothetical protein
MSTSVDDEVDKVPPMTTQMSSSVVISYETQAKERPRARGFSFKDVASREVQRSSSTDLDDADPEYAISLLRRGTANLTPLKLKLASCTDDWMLGFLDQGGLELVFVCLERLGERGFAKLAVAIDQLTCVGCIRAVMNSKVGLDHIVDNSRYVRTLAEAVDTSNVMVKMQVFDLLAAITVYSEDGYFLALDALNNYRKSKGQSYRFSLLVNELRNAETESYTLCLLSLINCIVSASPSVQERIRIRNEFIGLKLFDVMTQMRHTENDNINLQLDLFDEIRRQDEESMSLPTGVDLNSHLDMFNAVFWKVCKVL